jgi:sulfite reductase (NADPH) hemoprotein beta-component
MYTYSKQEKQLIQERALQFKDQTQRYLSKQLSEDEFLALRLMNGLYVQRHAPMLRVAVPYGLLNTKQLRKLGEISTKYDKGYAHLTTRQNVQYNWPALERVADILAELAEVEMHAVQTSGNCIRNVTTDEFAGVCTDESTDPRPWCELIRHWSTFHPEFAFLPRKFKIAVSATEEDRAAMRFHDIGVQIKTQGDQLSFDIYAGGGLGRTPVISSLIGENIRAEDLLSYLEAILRVYNLHGRRDNKFKARIKILVKAQGPETFRAIVEHEWN